MKDNPIIGIDLGTTNSCAAIVEGDNYQVKLIPYNATTAAAQKDQVINLWRKVAAR